MLIVNTLLICAEGTKTPAGGRVWGDPTGALAPRRLPGPPAESEVPRDRHRPPVAAVIIQEASLCGAQINRLIYARKK
ncbi:hypothetical protein QFZ31_000614 [Neobacillus niacini]|nr:hypothetical protein [Neobacillus niacini]